MKKTTPKTPKNDKIPKAPWQLEQYKKLLNAIHNESMDVFRNRIRKMSIQNLVQMMLMNHELGNVCYEYHRACGGYSQPAMLPKSQMNRLINIRENASSRVWAIEQELIRQVGQLNDDVRMAEDRIDILTMNEGSKGSRSVNFTAYEDLV